MKKWLKWIGIAIFGSGIVLGAPVVPVEMKWVVSYETIAFDTADGDLALDEYAISDNGWYIRTVPKEEGQFDGTENPQDIIGKKEVKIRREGRAYYDEFFDGQKIVRVQSEKTKYDGLRYTKDYPQPKKQKLENIINSINSADAAIAFQSATVSARALNATSVSFSHTVSAGSNLILFIADSCDDNDSGSYTATDASFNGDVASFIVASGEFSVNTNDMFYLVNPDVGTFTVSVSDDELFSCDGLKGIASGFTGVEQSSPIDNSQPGGNASASDVSISIATGVANTWIIDSHTEGTDSHTYAAQGSQIERWEGSLGNHGAFGSTLSAPSATTYNMAWDISTNDDWAGVAVSFKEATAAPATPSDAPNTPPIFFDGDSQLYPAKPERFTYQLKKINGRRSY